MLESHPLISVRIPTFNRRNVLERTLPTLFQQDFPSDRFEIVVVVPSCASQSNMAVLLRGFPRLSSYDQSKEARQIGRDSPRTCEMRIIHTQDQVEALESVAPDLSRDNATEIVPAYLGMLHRHCCIASMGDENWICSHAWLASEWRLHSVFEMEELSAEACRRDE